MSARIQRFVRGQSVASSRPQLNQLVDAVNGETTLGGSSVAQPGFVPQRVLVVQIRNLDQPVAGKMQCTYIGQELNPNAQIYVVELPWTFTETLRSGVSYVYTDINNRTADGTEVQQLTPIYIINDLVMIAEYEQGGIWRDLNIDGRQWAKVP